MTIDAERYEQGPISVDGGWFALVGGEWEQVRNPNLPRSVTPVAVPEGDFEEGPVSVDGVWFASSEGEWKHVGSVVQPDRLAGTIPDGYVSVDGALFHVDATADETEAA